MSSSRYAALPVFALLGVCCLAIPNCAGRFVTTSERVLTDADSLFAVGDYLHAKMAYGRVAASRPNTEWAEESQYRIGYISLFYGNPFADWESALLEFTKYQQVYPSGKHIDEVNTWLGILHSLVSYSQGYVDQAQQSEKMSAKHTFELRKTVGLADSLFRCEISRDSLERSVQNLTGRIHELEELILKLQ